MLLVMTALLVSALLLAYLAVTHSLGASRDGQLFILETLGLAVFVGSIRKTSPWRHRRLRVRWPLAVTMVGLLSAHIAIVGTFAFRWRGDPDLAQSCGCS